MLPLPSSPDLLLLILLKLQLERMRDGLTGDLGRHGGAAMMKVGDGFEEFLGRGLFAEIAGGASGQRLKDPVMIFKDGEHHDLDGRPEALEGLPAFMPAATFLGLSSRVQA